MQIHANGLMKFDQMYSAMQLFNNFQPSRNFGVSPNCKTVINHGYHHGYHHHGYHHHGYHHGYHDGYHHHEYYRIDYRIDFSIDYRIDYSMKAFINNIHQ